MLAEDTKKTDVKKKGEDHPVSKHANQVRDGEW